MRRRYEPDNDDMKLTRFLDEAEMQEKARWREEYDRMSKIITPFKNRGF